MEARSLKSGFGRVMVPLEVLEENHYLLASSSFWLWEMLGFCDLWHHSNLCFHLYILLLRISQISLCLSLTRTLMIAFSPTQITQNNFLVSRPFI